MKNIKRIFGILLLSGVMLSVSACTDKEEEKVLDKDTKSNIKLLEENIEIISDYRKEFDDYIEEYEKEDDIEAYMDKLEDVLDDLEDVEENIADVPKEAKYTEATDTYMAAKQYVEEVKALYTDLYDIAMFIDEFYKEIDELTENEFEMDNLESIEEAYYEWEEFVDDLNDIDCPEYLQHDFDRVVEAFEKCESVINTLYVGVYYDDVLRETSASYLLDVALDESDESADSLDEIIASQMEKMSDLADDRLKLMQEEFEANCEAILELSEVKEYSYISEESKPEITYEYEEEIYPALYNHIDSVVTIMASNEGGEKEVIVSVEIEGFTQAYEKTYTIDDKISVWDIKPTLATDIVDLSSMKTLQMVITVEDVDSGKVYLKDTKEIEVMSKFDWPSYNEEGEEAFYSILSWLEPESAQIKELKRIAADYVAYFDISGNGLDSIIGYQGATDLDAAYDIVIEQILAMQFAMADMGVKYNMSPFSLSTADDYVQRVCTPTETLESQSGICIETSLVIASAVQAAEMNAMLVITEGHCQVAVEIFESGEYFLVETTSIPTYIPETWDELSNMADTMIAYLTQDEWKKFVEEETANGCCYIIECNMAKNMGYLPFEY